MSRAAFIRMLRRHGEDWTMSAVTSTTRDEYEDELPDAAAQTTVRAIRVNPVGSSEEERDEKGRARWQRTDLLVRDDQALPAGALVTQPITLTSPEGQTFDLEDVNRMAVPVGAKRFKLRTEGASASLYP